MLKGDFKRSCKFFRKKWVVHDSTKSTGHHNRSINYRKKGEFLSVFWTWFRSWWPRNEEGSLMSTWVHNHTFVTLCLG